MSRPIKLLGEPIQNEDYKAAEAIIPGHLLDLNGSGDLIKHATAGGEAVPCRFALEREEMGKDIDDAYAIGDTVKVGHFAAGMRVNAIIGVVNVAKNDKLESAGNGTLRKHGTGSPSGKAIGIALEAKNNASGTARLRVEII